MTYPKNYRMTSEDNISKVDHTIENQEPDTKRVKESDGSEEQVVKDEQAEKKGEIESPNKKSSRARWPALESNPESFTKFIHKLGINETIAFHDVYGFEPDLLGMIPAPIYAIVFLFPPKRSSREPRPSSSDEEQRKEKDSVDEPFFLWQSKPLGNACGTLACIHALSNLRGEIPFDNESVLGQYLVQAQGKSYKEKGEILETFEPMRREQVKSATSNSNQTAHTEGHVDYHFVAFIQWKDGNVYELDGLKNKPVNHGAIPAGLSFGEKCGQIIQQEFMAKMPGEINFSTLALAPSFLD